MADRAVITKPLSSLILPCQGHFPGHPLLANQGHEPRIVIDPRSLQSGMVRLRAHDIRSAQVPCGTAGVIAPTSPKHECGRRFRVNESSDGVAAPTPGSHEKGNAD
jgi:hypothetical protein